MVPPERGARTSKHEVFERAWESSARMRAHLRSQPRCFGSSSPRGLVMGAHRRLSWASYVGTCSLFAISAIRHSDDRRRRWRTGYTRLSSASCRPLIAICRFARGLAATTLAALPPCVYKVSRTSWSEALRCRTSDRQELPPARTLLCLRWSLVDPSTTVPLDLPVPTGTTSFARPSFGVHDFDASRNDVTYR
jgi:hypothetical protein